MSETGNIDIGTPGEGGSGAPEQLSEQAKSRFAASGAAMAQIQREEKRSKKRDTRVAKTILQFLQDDRYTHLFLLISRLVARDCPSVFILAILSLINEDCRVVVKEYLEEVKTEMKEKSSELVEDDVQVMEGETIDVHTNKILIAWITRMQMVMALDAKKILQKLMVDEGNIDGTVLQLATFILQEFFKTKEGGSRTAPFESLQGLSVSILQTVFEPFLDQWDAPKKIEEGDDK
ncbi:hypothetical protein EXS70_02810 [Candidatus Peribacteria bacterium]|nr:hypothetical protein [Candidatus Peribacteria bacterium]